MNAIIKQIQEALEHGRPANIQTSPLASQVIKEIQKCTRTSEKSTHPIKNESKDYAYHD